MSSLRSQRQAARIGERASSRLCLSSEPSCCARYVPQLVALVRAVHHALLAVAGERAAGRAAAVEPDAGDVSRTHDVEPQGLIRARARARPRQPAAASPNPGSTHRAIVRAHRERHNRDETLRSAHRSPGGEPLLVDRVQVTLFPGSSRVRRGTTRSFRVRPTSTWNWSSTGRACAWYPGEARSDERPGGIRSDPIASRSRPAHALRAP
jgi:hypothetical protein